MNNLTQILAEGLGCKESEIVDKANFEKDLGMDSFDKWDLIIALETTYEIEILDEEVEKLKTVLQLKKYLRKKRVRCEN